MILFRSFVLITLITLTSCSTRPGRSGTKTGNDEVSELHALMSGEFSSREQSERDTLFFNINLVMYPIWEKDKKAKWLYVEQAVTEYIDRPYRQRVYRLSKTGDGLIESRVYELPGPEKYIHGWDNPALFAQITPDSLMVREGCAVYLKKDSEGCFSGSTKEKDCRSSLRGASYATSVVQICKDRVVSWDQGWNQEDVQVWGAETQGYIFQKKE